jgi:acetamidase/formamidase
MPTEHHLDATAVHYAWDRTIAPRLVVDAGDTVIFETRDSSDHYYNTDSSHEDVARKGALKGHPLTGPVLVRDAHPGDCLVVEVLEVTPRGGFGWTAIRPGRGLLSQEEFPQHYLQIWDLSGGQTARMPQRQDIAIPIDAFPGILGTALAIPGAHSTIPPRENGGNLDLKHLTPGAKLYLPVSVPGALLSAGDAHAAQGDGEVCITAVEMSATMTLRLDLQAGRAPHEPCLLTGGPLCRNTNTRPYFATTAHGPDLFDCSRRAVRYLIEHIVTERGLSREEAYILCSVCADLKITQIVDAPNWSVAAFLPQSVFI